MTDATQGTNAKAAGRAATGVRGCYAVILAALLLTQLLRLFGVTQFGAVVLAGITLTLVLLVVLIAVGVALGVKAPDVIWTASVDEAGIRLRSGAEARYLPRQAGLEVIVDETGPGLSIWIGSARHKALASSAADAGAIKARVLAWRASFWPEVPPDLRAVLERHGRAIDLWCQAIASYVSAAKPRASYRQESELAKRLLAVFENQDHELEARAAAAHALLLLEPSHRRIREATSDATPPLVLALMAHACQGEGAFSERLTRAQDFLSVEDQVTVKRLLGLKPAAGVRVKAAPTEVDATLAKASGDSQEEAAEASVPGDEQANAR